MHYVSHTVKHSDCSGLSLQLGADGVFADYVEALVAYLKFRRANSSFPKRQVRTRRLFISPSADHGNALRELPMQAATVSVGSSALRKPPAAPLCT